MMMFEPFEGREKFGIDLPHQPQDRGDDFLKANFKQCLGVHLLCRVILDDSEIQKLRETGYTAWERDPVVLYQAVAQRL